MPKTEVTELAPKNRQDPSVDEIVRRGVFPWLHSLVRLPS